MRTDSAPPCDRCSRKVLFSLSARRLARGWAAAGKRQIPRPGRARSPGQAGKPGPTMPMAAMTITTTPSRRGHRATVPATGSIYPWQEVIVGPEVGGYRVSAVLVDVGARVKKGQVLVRLRPTCCRPNSTRGRAALRSAEASEINAAAALRRGESVNSSGALSAADLDG